MHRISNDTNGNPRYVIHFLALLPKGKTATYEQVVKAANKVGGRKFHNKQFGGGVVFTAYECEIPEIISRVQYTLA